MKVVKVMKVVKLMKATINQNQNHIHNQKMKMI